MQLATLIDQLKNSLSDSAELIEDFEQQVVENALSDFSRYRPHTRVATFSLMTNQMLYLAPADLIRIRTVLYGQNQRAKQPWEQGYPRNLPRLSVIEGEDNQKWVQLSHYPRESVVMSCGRDVSYTYYASRKIVNGAISVDIQDEPLLLLRCMAEAVKYIAIHQLNKTVSTRNSIGAEAKNGTPAAIHEQLMAQFERQVKDA